MFDPKMVNNRHYTDGYTDGWRGNLHEPPLKGQPDERADYTRGFTDSRRGNARRAAR
jgi:hypothetical protein